MATIKKITKKERFLEMKEIFEQMGKSELIEFVDHEIELIDKKSTSRVATSTQKANEGLKETIKDFLNNNSNEMFTITQLQEKIETLKEFSNQKISALVSQLVKSGEINKLTEKRKSYFMALAED